MAMLYEPVSLTNSVIGQRRMAGPSTKMLHGAITLLLTWYRRRRSRIELARLDAHVIRDAGIDWLDARREADKPFWRE